MQLLAELKRKNKYHEIESEYEIVLSNYLVPLHIFCEAVPEGSVLSFVRSLGRQGVTIYVYLLGDTKGLRRVYASSRYCTKVIVVSEDNYKKKFTEHNGFLDLPNDSSKAILLPFTDKTAAIVAENKDFFDEKFNVMQADPEIVLSMLDKENANILAEKCGLSVPASVTISTLKQLAEVPNRLGFPFVLKPTWFKTNHSTGFKAVIVRNIKELLDVGRVFLKDGTTLMVQEYIEGEDNCVEFFLFYRTTKGRIYSCSGRKVLQFPRGRGLMAVGYVAKENFLEKQGRDFLNCLGYTGFGGLEFKLWQGKRYFIEMSVRPEGFISAAISSGLNFPWIGYSDLIGLEYENSLQQTKTSYYFNPFCCFGLVMTGQKKIRQCIQVLHLLIRKRASTDIFCLHDMVPFVTLFSILLKRKFRSLVNSDNR